MTTRTLSFSTQLRVVTAIAWKDVTDAIRSKNIRTILITIFIMLAIYRALPLLTSAGDAQEVVIFDQGRSNVGIALEDTGEFSVREVESRERMENRLGGENLPLLGVVLPANLEDIVMTSERIELQAYADHWVTDKQIGELRAPLEDELSYVLGKPVRLDVQTGEIYTRSDGGTAMIIVLSVLLAFAMIGLNLTPLLILEEKNTKTFDALVVSPATAKHVMLGKFLAGLFYCAAAEIAILAVHARFVVSWGSMIVGLLMGSILMVAVGLLLGSIVRSRQQLGLWVFLLVQILLIPAVVVPLGFMPQTLNQILQWIPTVAAAAIVRNACTAAAPLGGFILEMGLIVAWTALILGGVVLQLRKADA